tara:strand:- start:571 stop:963 length:393 start_codon:yes stop_codon:yes gene_type:complete
MKKLLLILLCLPILYHCNSNKNEKEIIIDIKKDNYNDSIHFNKDVNVIFLKEFWFGDDAYLVDMYFNSSDTLRNAKVSLATEDIYDQARYYWITDTSINITLYDSKGDSSVSFYAAGTMDGRGSAIGDLE